MKENDQMGTYSKVYWLQADPEKTDAMFEHLDAVVVPMVREKLHHGSEIIYQFISSEPGRWLLISNYQTKQAAEDAVPLVQEIVGPMVEMFGITLDVLTEGEIHRLVRR